MKKIHSVVLDVGLRVQEFLDANAAVVGSINQSMSRTRLDQGVAAMQAHAVGQIVGRIGAVGETRNQLVLRTLIRGTYMRPIAEIASACLADVPQFAELHTPRGNLIGARFIAAGRAMADAATPYLGVLTNAGPPASILDELRAALDRLQESVGERHGHSQARSLATQSLDQGERAIRRSVRALDGAVRHALSSQPDLLAVWQQQKRYPRRPRTGTDTNT